MRNEEFCKTVGILHLHGNVAFGYNKEEERAGSAGMYIKLGGEGYLEPTKLLYPVEKKGYNADEFIKGQWEALSDHIQQAERVTVFGYRAPESDVEAIQLLQDAWGTPDQRNMEEFELIDIREEQEVKKSWETFIHSHHYGYSTSFFDSSLAQHPRRTVESYHHWSMPFTPSEMFQEGNPVPQNFGTLQEMWQWYQPLLDAEERYYSNVLK